jgi:integrase
LRGRLDKFAADFQKDARDVTTAEIQEWLDSKKLGTQTYANNRRVLSVFFEFCVARGYASDSPVDGVENVKVHNGEIEIFTPSEIARLLAAASEDFLPSLALGAFAGLRSAEIERLDWKDIHLAERHIVIGKDAAKTASRRVVPITDNLAAWLALTPEAKRTGKVWKGGWLYKEQQVCADATATKPDAAKNIPAKAAVKWKSNALRHSFATYSFALSNDAGRIAGIMGNSPAIVNRHYRQLTTPAVAQKWFAVYPPGTALPTPAAQIANT